MKDLFFKDLQLFVLCAILGVLMVFGFYFDPSALKLAFLDLAFGLCLALFVIKVTQTKLVIFRRIFQNLSRLANLQRIDPLLN